MLGSIDNNTALTMVESLVGYVFCLDSYNPGKGIENLVEEHTLGALLKEISAEKLPYPNYEKLCTTLNRGECFCYCQKHYYISHRPIQFDIKDLLRSIREHYDRSDTIDVPKDYFELKLK